MARASNQSIESGYPKRVFQPLRSRATAALVSHPRRLTALKEVLPTQLFRTSDVSLQRLLEATKILVWEAEAESWRFNYVCEQAKEILGYPITDWYEQDFLAKHIHPDDKHWISCQRQFQVGDQYDLTFRMLSSDGRVVWFHNLIGVTARVGEPKRMSGFMIDISERKRAEEALKDLGGRLIAAQEKERSRIARELHDDFNQRLALLSIELEQLGETIPSVPGNRQLLEKLQRQAQEISSDIHRLSYRLHPAKLDHLGLAAAIRSLCEEVSKSTDIKIEIQQNRFPTTLPKDIALCLFRVAQEALRNSVKHSGAQSIRVLLWKTSNTVRLSVLDDGCGFDPKLQGTQNGLGFISMKERVHLLGGEMAIGSQPQSGTCVEDEPYFIELQDPASTHVLLTADYGPDATSPTIGTLYPSDTSLRPDGKTRVLGYTRAVGKGGVTYVALGHCHNPAIRASRTVDPTDTTPLTFRGSWEADAFLRLLRNAIAWGVGD